MGPELDPDPGWVQSWIQIQGGSGAGSKSGVRWCGGANVWVGAIVQERSRMTGVRPSLPIRPPPTCTQLLGHVARPHDTLAH